MSGSQSDTHPTSSEQAKMNPGDDAPPGTPGTGDNVCPECSGKGKLESGGQCPNCGGTGQVTQIVGDA